MLPRAPTPSAGAPPIPLPTDSVYTACYCEENAYLLARALVAQEAAAAPSSEGQWDVYVVVVSNGGKTVRA